MTDREPQGTAPDETNGSSVAGDAASGSPPSAPAPAASGAAPAGSPAPTGDASATPGHSVARRRFFRQFAGEVVHGAATVVGMAGAIQRQSMEAAQTILGAGSAAMTQATDTAAVAQVSPALEAPTGFRTAFRWESDAIYLIDQRRLPRELAEIRCQTGGEVAWAIREMAIRGAPAMGQAAAIGIALTAQAMVASTPFVRRAAIKGTATALVNARPTAINVRWAADRCIAAMDAVGDVEATGKEIADAIRLEAEAIVTEAAEDHERLAGFGLAELPDPIDRPLQVLTHCNTGPLACGQFGTALGIVQAAVHAGRSIHVFVDETRPYLQGARLTAWELAQAGVGHTVIADAAAGWVFGNYTVDAVLVGADRIAANGDTANKIGTYPLAVLARRHGIPFYVCAPLSSVDLTTATGADIPIEQRPSDEVTTVRGTVVAPPGTKALNPAFDVTPNDLITGIVTEVGVLRAPFGPALAVAVEAASRRATDGRAGRTSRRAGAGPDRTSTGTIPDTADTAAADAIAAAREGAAATTATAGDSPVADSPVAGQARDVAV